MLASRGPADNENSTVRRLRQSRQVTNRRLAGMSPPASDRSRAPTLSARDWPASALLKGTDRPVMRGSARCHSRALREARCLPRAGSASIARRSGELSAVPSTSLDECHDPCQPSRMNLVVVAADADGAVSHRLAGVEVLPVAYLQRRWAITAGRSSRRTSTASSAAACGPRSGTRRALLADAFGILTGRSVHREPDSMQH